MTVPTASCEEEDETARTARARIDDTSPSGARFWLKVPIRSGPKAEVSWRRGEDGSPTRHEREWRPERTISGRGNWTGLGRGEWIHRECAQWQCRARTTWKALSRRIGHGFTREL